MAPGATKGLARVEGPEVEKDWKSGEGTKAPDVKGLVVPVEGPRLADAVGPSADDPSADTAGDAFIEGSKGLGNGSTAKPIFGYPRFPENLTKIKSTDDGSPFGGILSAAKTAVQAMTGGALLAMGPQMSQGEFSPLKWAALGVAAIPVVYGLGRLIDNYRIKGLVEEWANNPSGPDAESYKKQMLALSESDPERLAKYLLNSGYIQLFRETFHHDPLARRILLNLAEAGSGNAVCWLLRSKDFSPEVLTFALKTLRDPDSHFRRVAAEYLVYSGTPEAFEVLQEALMESPDPDVQGSIIVGLANNSSPQTATRIVGEFLKKNVGRGSMQNTDYAITYLALIGTPEAMQVLIEVAKRSEQHANRVISTLTYHPRGVEAIAGIVIENLDPHVSLVAIHFLGREIGTLQAGMILLHLAAKHESEAIRRAAADALKGMDEETREMILLFARMEQATRVVAPPEGDFLSGLFGGMTLGEPNKKDLN